MSRWRTRCVQEGADCDFDYEAEPVTVEETGRTISSRHQAYEAAVGHMKHSVPFEAVQEGALGHAVVIEERVDEGVWVERDRYGRSAEE